MWSYLSPSFPTFAVNSFLTPHFAVLSFLDFRRKLTKIFFVKAVLR